MKKRLLCIILLFGSLFAAVAVLSVLVGAAPISPCKILWGLVRGWYGGVPLIAPHEKTILLSIRVPRIILAATVGAALSLSGVVFQAILRNPLAEPFILGMSGGAAVGAIAGILIGFGTSSIAIPTLAFSGAFIAVAIVFVTGRRAERFDATTMLLAGVVVNAFCSAIIMFLISLSGSAGLRGITFWLMGNLGSAAGGEIALALFVLTACAGVVFALARPLNLIVAGEETAMHLGIDVERTKIILFTATSLMTAVAVSYAGIIGFVGLVIPHMTRMLLGSDHRIVLPASLFFGAAFLVAADTVARIAVPHAELPVGVITAFIGAPFFVYLLRTKVR